MVLALFLRKDKEEMDKQMESGWQMLRLVKMNVIYEMSSAMKGEESSNS